MHPSGVNGYHLSVIMCFNKSVKNLYEPDDNPAPMTSRTRHSYCIMMVLCRTVLLAFFVYGSVVHATSVVEVTMEEMLQNSELVFEGRVTDVKVREHGNYPVQTWVTFEILDVIKGKVKGEKITLGFLGGEVAGRKLSVSNMHMPELNEHGIYFVESPGRNLVQPLYGWSQGHLKIEKDPAGQDRVFTRSGQPVRGVERTNGKRSGGPSHGAARGLILGDYSDADGALEKKDFKQLLRAMQ